MNDAEEIDTEFTDAIRCPWCGYDFTDSWELNDSDEAECGQCDKPLVIEIHETVSYCTRKVRPVAPGFVKCDRCHGTGEFCCGPCGPCGGTGSVVPA